MQAEIREVDRLRVQIAMRRRIIELEAISAEGITFQLYVDASFRPNVSIFDHLEYAGKHAFYRVRRLTPE